MNVRNELGGKSEDLGLYCRFTSERFTLSKESPGITSVHPKKRLPSRSPCMH